MFYFNKFSLRWRVKWEFVFVLLLYEFIVKTVVCFGATTSTKDSGKQTRLPCNKARRRRRDLLLSELSFGCFDDVCFPFRYNP